MDTGIETYIPKNWELTKVDHLFDVVGGGTPSTKNEEYWGGEFPWITSADIHGVKDIRPRKNVTQLGIDCSTTNLVPANSIIVVTRVALGKVALTNKPLCFSQDSQALVPKGHDVDQEYALHYLSTAVKEFKHTGRGTTISGVTKKQLKDLPFLLPPLREQLKIVEKLEELLSQLDKANLSIRSVSTKLERYKGSLLKAACEGWLVPTEEDLARREGRDYEPASVLLERILAERRAKWEEKEWAKHVARAKQKTAKAARKAAGNPLKRGEKLQPEEWEDLPESEYGKYLPKDERWKEKYKEPAALDADGLPELPEGWVWVSTDMVAYHRLGKMLDKSKNSGELRPYLRNINVRWGSFDLSDVATMKVEDQEMSNVSIKQGDLVICEGGEPGRCAVWRQVESIVIQKALHRVRIHSDILPEFFMYCLMNDAISGSLEKHFTGSTISHFTGQSLSTYLFPLPPKIEQKAIVEGLSRALTIIDRIQHDLDESCDQIKALRNSILNRAFSGSLVEQDVSDEPANVLLERIRAQRDA